MIINEDYFKDLEITDDDVIEDDNLDVEEPKQELTLDEFYKLPEQYEHCIEFQIDHNHWITTDISTTFFQTSLIPRIFKRLDTIFEMYGFEHSEYTLSLYSFYRLKDCDTIVEYGNYQLFCLECSKREIRSDDYWYLYIRVFVNYPKFNYKRAFRFVYAMLNIFRLDEHINHICFEPTSEHHISDDLNFVYEDKVITFKDFGSNPTYELILSDKKLPERGKEKFYKYVFHYFFDDIDVPYKLLKRDVLLKPIKLL